MAILTDLTRGNALENISSFAFDSTPDGENVSLLQNRTAQRNLGQTQSFRQTTLSGRPFQDQQVSQSQSISNRPYLADLPPEAPTHHELDHEALKTWVYPTNLGDIRDYQYSIVKNGLFHNTLVALPTGLGKTFIAATVMLNFYRWTTEGKIIFTAPTKPLASQQVEACLNVAGISRSAASLLTGEISPALREEEWKKRRVFFMTPQTLQNDLSKGYVDPKTIALLVVDEAHRATGDYSYVKVVNFIRRFSRSFRVLALTATPGSSVETVQEVIDSLGISHVEIRNENSLDLRPYIHARETDRLVLEPSDEMLRVQELFSKALKPVTDKLSAQNVYWGRDPMSINVYSMLKAKQQWMSGAGRQANPGVKWMMIAVFGLLSKLAHAVKLLTFHGINPFYENLVDFRSEAEDQGKAGGKFQKQLLGDANFQEMMTLVEKWRKLDDFVSHPKMPALCERLLNHFMDSGEQSTRAIVFCEYRHSAEDIVRTLNNQPMIKAAVFVGQSDSRGSAGMKQKQQMETIEKFKQGAFNVLVATSVGEEGLDIGQVDLIVCYDASASPIRMLQRMGRTGRKRTGNVLLLLMKGTEENKFEQAKDNYEAMQNLISDGSRFTYRHELSSRIVPRDVRPEVDKRHVEIPIENTQDRSLPEPRKKSRNVKQKASKKKFNMPDGVETGFVTAATNFFGKAKAAQASPRSPKLKVPPPETDMIAMCPDLDSAVLNRAQELQLQRLYKTAGSGPALEEIEAVNLKAHREAQRRLQSTQFLKHGEYTRRMVKLFKKLGNLQNAGPRWARPFGETDSSDWKAIPVPSFAGEVIYDEPRASAASKRAWSGDMVGEATTCRPKKRKVTNTKGQSSKAASRGPSIFLDDMDDNILDVDQEEDLREAGSAAPARAGRRGSNIRASTATRRPKGRGKNNGLKHVGGSLEDVGEDCTRTSDVEDTDGSDDGADLVDFVVSDDRVESSMRCRGSSTPGSSSPRPRPEAGSSLREGLKQTPQAKRFSAPIEFAPTQETDDFPTVGELVGTASSSKKAPEAKKTDLSWLESDEEVMLDHSDQDVVRRPVGHGPRRRPTVPESDDDDDV